VHSPLRGRIGPSSLPQHVAHGGVTASGSLEAAKEEFERRFVKAALASAGGQRAKAAEALGVTRQGLAKMMRRLRID
jgi:transcriptional regulator with GAF, ATPase, and Fis domain